MNQGDGTTTRLRTPDGSELFVRRWEVAPGSSPWARVLLAHGLAEHSGRWALVGDRFAGLGLETHAFDLRGFGQSSGRPADVSRFGELHDDMEAVVRAVRATEPPLPLVLYGHSLGGLIALGYALDGRTPPDLLVLSAPGIDSGHPAWLRALVAAVARVAPTVEFSNRVEPSWLSHDPVVAARYVSDPHNRHRSTARFGAAGFGEQRRVRRLLAARTSMPVPTLVIHGDDDRIVPPAAVATLQGLGNVTYRVYPGLRHEIHNEADGARIATDVADWIRGQVGYNPDTTEDASGERSSAESVARPQTRRT